MVLPSPNLYPVKSPGGIQNHDPQSLVPAEKPSGDGWEKEENFNQLSKGSHVMFIENGGRE